MNKEKAKEAGRMLKFALFSVSAGLIEMGSYALLADAVEQMPTVDPVPAKSGEWILTDFDGLACSNCMEEAPYVSHFQGEFDYDYDGALVSIGYKETKDYQRTKYCPNCGARMKEADYE